MEPKLLVDRSSCRKDVSLQPYLSERSTEALHCRPNPSRHQDLAESLDKVEVAKKYRAVRPLIVRPRIASVPEKTSVSRINSKMIGAQTVEKREPLLTSGFSDDAIRMCIGHVEQRSSDYCRG